MDTKPRGYMMYFGVSLDGEAPAEPTIVNIHRRRSDAVQALAGWRRWWQAASATVVADGDHTVQVEYRGILLLQTFRAAGSPSPTSLATAEAKQ
jgi:hypothetical protein